jgi:hypothetical protein
MSSPSMALSLSLSCACTLALASTASATFTGFSVQTQQQSGLWIHKVYANFSTSASLLSMFGVTRSSGELNAVNLASDGMWTLEGPQSNSSFVTTCSSPVILEGFQGDSDTLPGSWRPEAPSAASSMSCLVAQIAQAQLSPCVHGASVSYKVTGGTAIIFASGTITLVPTPGALAGLLALGFTTRRRRS